MGGKGKNGSGKPSTSNDHDNPAFEGDPGDAKKESKKAKMTKRGKDEADKGHHSVFNLDKSPRILKFGEFAYPTVCTYCKSLWDIRGETDLISPCGCSATGLHVHQTCLTSWLHNSGKVRCEACKTVYTNASVKEIRKQLLMQKANLCVIVILMPVGAVLTVTACLLYDAAVKARKHTRLTGEPSDFFGVPTGSFVILCMVFSLVIIASIWASVRMMTRKKTKPGDELKMLTVSKV